MVKVKIDRLSDQLEGIGYVDGKIIFVPKTIPGDTVDVKIIEEKSKYLRGKVSGKLTQTDCPFFYNCGGCSLRNTTYDNSVLLKKNNLESLLKKNNIMSSNINVFDNKIPFNYRNKISLKIVNGKIGFFEEGTNDIVEINNCLIARDAINNFLEEIPKLNIKNGFITIRCNYNNELLIIIETKDKINYDYNLLKNNHKIAGVVLNNKCVLNNDYFFDKINNYLFKISYNSFFQINNYCAGKIFEIIENNINKDDVVLDLYSGVGTLSICSSIKAKSVIGVEVVPNAVKNALINKEVNKVKNVEFMLGDVSKIVNNLKQNFTTIIFDPPRKGLDKKTIEFTLKKLPNKIIYVSCNAITLVRDLKLLSDIYNVSEVYMLDMFSYSYHFETVCILERK
jgi:23S rRNA (uracil1939-C5)-methyltransferase